MQGKSAGINSITQQGTHLLWKVTVLQEMSHVISVLSKVGIPFTEAWIRNLVGDLLSL